ncbi:MAG TPA: FAD-linked oxidase C-terminal domain-containing protein [Pseudolysinimonas sp.]|nr:FAD-linked oxidase C-terminal domain-containing protein [Pseudolysinimonas sp.]
MTAVPVAVFDRTGLPDDLDIVLGEAELDLASIDRSGALPSGRPWAQLRPQSVAEVQSVVRWASERSIALIPRGAGSGLAGAALAGEGAVVLDLTRMDAIVEIRVDDQVAVVQPGVITAALDAEARHHGLFYAPDPGSVGISTIGGNIATNAGGLRGAKYGVTRDAVLALDVVLADGRLVRLGRETVKGVAGYDLASLIVGSEGTLGIVVSATLRLLPVPAAVSTAAVFLPSLAAAANAVLAIGRSGARPTVLEIVDRATLAAIDSLDGTDFASQGEAFLLVQTDGFGASLEMEHILSVVAPFATSIESTDDPDAAQTLLHARRQALPAIEALGRVLIEDIAVPRSRLADAIGGVHAIAERTGARIFVFAHAGDGNVHPIILLPPEGEGVAELTAAEAIFALALELGGTIAAEHGVGALKRDWAARELGRDVGELQLAVKALFDPSGILNPGRAV